MAKLYERYYLAKPWIRIIARLIDMIINSILVVISVIFVISFFKVDKDAVLTIVSIIIYVYLLLFLHFVLLP